VPKLALIGLRPGMTARGGCPYISNFVGYARAAEAVRRATAGKGRTLGGPAFCASQRSLCTCIFSQKSADVPSAADKRKDIGAVMLAWPLRIRERCARVIPSRSAASLTVMPSR
jgi:hypothetical protein